jgi:adenine phosphoribosyltransferase
LDEKVDKIRAVIKSYPDFPKSGILFHDVLPIFANPEATRYLADVLIHHIESLDSKPDIIVGLEARGFFPGILIASRMGLPFVPIRKKGKLPGAVKSVNYQLEYGSACFEISVADIKGGQKCLVVDDLLATGGSLKAAAQLIQSVGGSVVECMVIIEIVGLHGSKTLEGTPFFSLLKY